MSTATVVTSSSLDWWTGSTPGFRPLSSNCSFDGTPPLCLFPTLEQASHPRLLYAPTGQDTECLRPPELGAGGLPCAAGTHIHIPDSWALWSEPLLVFALAQRPSRTALALVQHLPLLPRVDHTPAVPQAFLGRLLLALCSLGP